MPKSQSDIESLISMVEDARRANNILWMDILRLAFDKAPKEASKIMKQIVANDREITRWLKKL